MNARKRSFQNVNSLNPIKRQITFLHSPCREDPVRFALSNGQNFKLEYLTKDDELALISV